MKENWGQASCPGFSGAFPALRILEGRWDQSGRGCGWNSLTGDREIVLPGVAVDFGQKSTAGWGWEPLPAPLREGQAGTPPNFALRGYVGQAVGHPSEPPPLESSGGPGEGIGEGD